MPSYPIQFGPFEAIYIGDYGAGVTLTRALSLRTEGSDVSDKTETEYTPLIGAREQVGNRIVTCKLTFIENDLAKRVSKGLPINTNATNPPGTAQYTLFCVSGSYTTKTSWYFPQVSTLLDLSIQQSKKGFSLITNTFTNENRDMNVQNAVPDTVANLLTLMGSSLAPIIWYG